MEIDYSDGRAIEERILERLSKGASEDFDVAPDPRSTSLSGLSYDEWALKYHLSPLRHHLFRPFCFDGLSVLEVGAGMGALSTFLADRAKYLTVIEGTQRRFSALSKRLEGFKNWDGIVGNFKDVVPDPRFDVVCVVGVLEYAGLFLSAPGGKGAYREFIAHAKKFLKPGGVLFLAIENKLGAKYFAGAPEDHTGKLFDGVCGYTLSPSPKTFSRIELLEMLTQEGFLSVREFYPYPDYKFPETVITKTMAEEHAGVAVSLCAQEHHANGSESFPLFPETLLADSLARAGVLKDFANSLLFVASDKSDSETLRRFLRESKAEPVALAWSIREGFETAGIEVYTAAEGGRMRVSAVNQKNFSVISQGLLPLGGISLRIELVRASYQGDWGRVAQLLEKYFTVVFEENAVKEAADLVADFAMKMSPLRAFLVGPVGPVGNDERISCFPVLSGPGINDEFEAGRVRKSAVILAALVGLRERLPIVLSNAPQRTISSLYLAFCDRFGLRENLSLDWSELNVRGLANGTVCADLGRDNPVSVWPREPGAEFVRGHGILKERDLYQKWMKGYGPRIWRFAMGKLPKGFYAGKNLLAPTDKALRAVIRNVRGFFTQWASELVGHSSGPGRQERTFNFRPVHALPRARWSRLSLRFSKPVALSVLVETPRAQLPLLTTSEKVISWSGILDVDDDIKGFTVRVDGDSKHVVNVTLGWTPIPRFVAAGFLLLRSIEAILFRSVERRRFLAGLRIDGVRTALRSIAIGCLTRGDEYAAWQASYEPRSESVRREMALDLLTWKSHPLISILVPVCDPPVDFLKELILSVRAQSYSHWELCFSDDASETPEVRKLLEEFSAIDSRIKVKCNEKRCGIAVATNGALQLATGEISILVDHDDTLSPEALYHVARVFVWSPELVFAYSDEDKIDKQGRRYAPHFKPQWNPLLLYGYNYVTHLAAYRTSRLRQLGGLKEGYEGSQDHELVLRYTEGLSAHQITHIPFVLYHWRAHPGSVALAYDQKESWIEASRRAIHDHFARTGTKANVQPSRLPYLHRVKFEGPVPPEKVSVIVCTRDRADLLRRSVMGILSNTEYPNLELILIDNQSVEPGTKEFFAEIRTDSRVRIIEYDGPFNFSAMNNRGASEATGDLLLLFNNDLGVIEPGWLQEMTSYFALSDVGIVGAKLYYPDDRVQHAGLVFGPGGVAGHCQKGVRRENSGYFGWLEMSRFVGGVTGACLLVRASVYKEVGGLDSLNLPVAFNDVDFCLRVRRAGKQIVFTPFAELYHFESATRGSDLTLENVTRFQSEIAFMKAKWKAELTADPYYNPNLTIEKEDFTLAFPPRQKEPWKQVTPTLRLKAPPRTHLDNQLYVGMSDVIGPEVTL